MLLGIVNDKDASTIAKFLSGKFRHVIVSEPTTKRKQDGAELIRHFKYEGQKAEFVKDVKSAYNISLNILSKNDSLIVLGSHYLVGAIMKKSK